MPKVQNKKSLGERLLSILLNERSEVSGRKEEEEEVRSTRRSKPFSRNCVLLRCLRDGTVRFSIGSILEVLSPTLCEQLRGCNGSASDSGMPTIDLNMSGDVLDFVLRYSCTGKMLPSTWIPLPTSIQLLRAATQILDLPELADNVSSQLVKNLAAHLTAPSFLNATTDDVDDIRCLEPIIDQIHPSKETTLRIINNLSEWSMRSDRHSAVGLALINGLTDARRRRPAQRTWRRTSATQQKSKRQLIGEQLLCRIKDADARQAAALDEERARTTEDRHQQVPQHEWWPQDCVLIKCARDGVLKPVHGVVLELYSEVCATKLRKMDVTSANDGFANSSSSSSSGGSRVPPVIELNVSSDILDLMIEYFYTTKPVEVPVRLAVQLLGAAKRSFDVPDLAQQMSDCIATNIAECLLEPLFLNATTDSPDDVACLTDVIDRLELDRKATLTFVRRLTKWSEARESNRALALDLINRLISAQQHRPLSLQTIDGYSDKHFALIFATMLCAVWLLTMMISAWYL